MTKAKFITFDGIDGAGKSTQIRLLNQRLVESGRDVLLVRDPGATSLGEAVRDILLHREEIDIAMRAEMLLYMAARAQLVAEKIKPALEQGTTVISDRFLLSNVVYQGSAGGLAIDQIWNIGEIAIDGIKPDLAIVLDLDAAEGLRRVGTGTDRLEKRGLAYFEKVRQGFLDQHFRSANQSIIIDASQSPDDIANSIWKFVSPHLTY